jgi:hypothetical protein
MVINKIIEARQIIPRHKANYQRLLDTMPNGWQGRPILARPAGDGIQALTGSHRIATATYLGLSIPVLLLEDSDLDIDGWDAIDAAIDDDDLLIVLRDYGIIAAAELLAQEPNLGGI